MESYELHIFDGSHKIIEENVDSSFIIWAPLPCEASRLEVIGNSKKMLVYEDFLVLGETFTEKETHLLGVFRDLKEFQVKEVH